MLASKLRRAERRIQELEAELSEARPADRKRNGGVPPTPGELDLNDATFEQLRDLDLSVTQTARVLAYREARGTYSSLDELEQVPGISKRTLTRLRSFVSVSASAR